MTDEAIVLWDGSEYFKLPWLDVMPDVEVRRPPALPLPAVEADVREKCIQRLQPLLRFLQEHGITLSPFDHDDRQGITFFVSRPVLQRNRVEITFSVALNAEEAPRVGGGYRLHPSGAMSFSSTHTVDPLTTAEQNQGACRTWFRLEELILKFKS